MCETNNPNEDKIIEAVDETIALFNYYLGKASHREKPASKGYVSEPQEDAIRGIVRNIKTKLNQETRL